MAEFTRKRTGIRNEFPFFTLSFQLLKRISISIYILFMYFTAENSYAAAVQSYFFMQSTSFVLRVTPLDVHALILSIFFCFPCSVDGIRGSCAGPYSGVAMRYWARYSRRSRLHGFVVSRKCRQTPVQVSQPNIIFATIFIPLIIRYESINYANNDEYFQFVLWKYFAFDVSQRSHTL